MRARWGLQRRRHGSERSGAGAVGSREAGRGHTRAGGEGGPSVGLREELIM
jgi:hypothetical protein